MGYILVFWIVGGLGVFFWLRQRHTNKYGKPPRTSQGYLLPWENEDAAQSEERNFLFFIAWAVIGGILAILAAILQQ